IDCCLAADPAQRYRDAGAVLAALERRERRRRKRPLVVFGVLAPLALVTGLGVVGITAAWATHNAVVAVKDASGKHDNTVDATITGLVRDIVADKLQDMRQKMRVLAKNPNLEAGFQQYLEASERGDEQAKAKTAEEL